MQFDFTKLAFFLQFLDISAVVAVSCVPQSCLGEGLQISSLKNHDALPILRSAALQGSHRPGKWAPECAEKRYLAPAIGLSGSSASDKATLKPDYRIPGPEDMVIIPSVQSD